MKANSRRYRSTSQGYATFAVHNATQRADRLGVPRRCFAEEEVLFALEVLAFQIKQATGVRVEVHHGLRSLADGGEHSWESCVLLSASTHQSWHTTARAADRPISFFMKRAVKKGEVVKYGEAWVEQVLLDKYLAAIQPAAANDNDQAISAVA